MLDSIARLVYPVFDAGISLRERLESGQQPDWEQERSALIRHLARLEPEGLDAVQGPDEIQFDLHAPDDPNQQRGLTRATVRYALTAWLDEFLGRHSAWSTRWQAETLEVELYATQTRNTKFWDESRYAETRGDLEALDVMVLCVMLGFRGDWAAKPHLVEAWTRRVQTLLQERDAPWTPPPCLAAPAREANLPTDWPYRGMLVGVALTCTLIVPLGLMAAWRWWNV